ncbi:hypothetical protein EXE08_01100 [Acinetobacter pittii]|nr:hypothetical protein EXE08_01100 [Acinetobacter pittii]
MVVERKRVDRLVPIETSTHGASPFRPTAKKGGRKGLTTYSKTIIRYGDLRSVKTVWQCRPATRY